MLIEPFILVYDDDRVTALELAAILGDAGYDNIQIASHFKFALAAIEQGFRVDLLLSDIVVPNGLDGIALSKIARLRHPLIRVIFVSGYAFGSVERAIGWPMLSKPICEEVLIAEANRALGFA